MAHGLRIRNSAGSIQIDETYKNQRVVQSGTITVGTTNISSLGGFPAYLWSITIAGVNPVIAIRPTAIFAGVWSVVQSGGNFTFYGLSDTSGGSLPYFIFDNPPTSPPAGSGWAFRVRNPATNELTFDSAYKYSRVVDFQPSPTIPFSTTGSTTDFSYPSGRNYAVVMASPGTACVHAPGGLDPSFFRYFYTLVVAKITDGLIQYKTQFYDGGGPTTSPPPSYQSPFSAMILDVTNY